MTSKKAHQELLTHNRVIQQRLSLHTCKNNTTLSKIVVIRIQCKLTTIPLLLEYNAWLSDWKAWKIVNARGE